VLTGREEARLSSADGKLLADPGRDLLKLCVVNRYADAPPTLAWVRGFGLKRGAIASSVAHDSHNIVAVGCDDAALCRAVNQVIEQRGGLATADDEGCSVLPLPVAGIMSDQDGFEVAAAYARIDEQARALGSPLSAPFMTLSFMALLVIPELKLSDKGLFDGRAFRLLESGKAG
jgi:adenine deaminase